MKQIITKLRNHFPSKLPIGKTELEEFSTSILETYDIPKMDSYHHAIASMIMHLGPTTTAVPKLYFAKSIKKAMANEVAFHKIQEIKEREKKAAAEKKAAEEEAAKQKELESKPAIDVVISDQTFI